MADKLNSHLPDISRRTFLKGTAGTMAALTVATAYTLDAKAQEEELDPALRGLTFLNAHEADTINALAEQFWPTTEASPGAIDAAVVIYIDRALSGAYFEYQRIYQTGIEWLDQAVFEQYGADFVDLAPDQQLTFLQNVMEGSQATPSAAATPGAGTPAAATPIAEGTPLSEGTPVSDATPELLEVEGMQIAGAATPAAEAVSMQKETVTGVPMIAGGDPPTIGSLADFLEVVLEHTIEGMFSDPVYGGNRNFAGWNAVSYGGPYYIHTEEQQTTFEPLILPPQSIADL